ncbi:hypothetical protein A5687_21285 [Mycobacterium mantenii]|nr:hypothetical protein A5687_21285 [Mycobacterium mantenii]
MLALALAVVKPRGGARLLDEDNKADSAGWVSIEDAVESGRAFFVDLKGTLAAFDLDTPELVLYGEALENWARSEGLPVLVASSGRDGHRHLYVRFNDRTLVEDHARSLGIPKSAHRRSIRPPLSPHRKGLKTALLSPKTVAEALQVLGPAEQGEAHQKNLPRWLIDLINKGDTNNRYAGRSQMALAIASGVRRTGYDFATFRAVMANRENLGGAKYHALEDGEGNEDPEKFLTRTWEKAADQLTPHEILAEISNVRTAIQAVEWRGRTGNTDRAVMLALCELGTASGTTALTFGSRRIAVVAQVEDRTVRKALGRLVTEGWLRCEKASGIGDADTYRFGPKLDKMTALNPSPPISIGARCGNNDRSDGDRVLLHPVFRNRSGLGKNTGRTWSILASLGRPATAKEVAEAGAGERRTVDRHLRLLEKHGLATKSGIRWTASGDDRKLDELAVDLGAIQRSGLQADRYDRNRAGFRMARALKESYRARSGDGSDLDDAEIERLLEEHERRCSEEEQEMLRQVGLPHHLG